MTVVLGVVMDPIASINVKKDTTLAMLLAAQKRGWELEYMEQSSLFLDQGKARAISRKLRVADDPQDWFELGEPREISMTELDTVLMRKDPPFDMDFIYSTYILEAAQREGTLVVNDPQSLRDCNEKLFATQFPECCPPLIVAASQCLIANISLMVTRIILILRLIVFARPMKAAQHGLFFATRMVVRFPVKCLILSVLFTKKCLISSWESIVTMMLALPWQIHWRRLPLGRVRCKAQLTGLANGVAMPI